MLLGLWSVPKEDTGFSVSKAALISPLTVPGEFLDGGEIPYSQFLQKIEGAVFKFAVSPPHHVAPSPSTPLLPALLAAQFVFVREDASVPPLAPLYRSPYLVLERRGKFFRHQMGDKTDVVSVDRLKPAFSDVPISLPPLRGRPALKPPPDAVPVARPPPAVVHGPAHWKTVTFHLPPEVPTCQNPHRAARGRRICSAISPPFFLEHNDSQDYALSSISCFIFIFILIRSKFTS